MVSFRFLFLFSQPPKLPISAASNASRRPFSVGCSIAIATTVVTAAGGGIAISRNPNNPFLQDALNFLTSNFSPKNNFTPLWGSISLADNSAPVTESRTGMSFPAVLKDSQQLLGIGLRRKAILGLKNIDVYAYGVYADDGDVKKFLGEKYGALSTTELKGNKQLDKDLMESDVRMTVRLQIVYGKLSIRSVRNAFEESIGSRLKKFGTEDKELLQKFTSQFKDEYKLPRGSIIDLSREQGYVLRTTIDGVEVGSIESKLLCRSILDLYIGNEPFDRKAKEDVELNLASLLGK
ncbi:fatty-acid-binding protein 1-like isoform X1 [Olea europaea var. sylvestris]|uniref:fatty-acid-binding protein 1-like isoform X1 n=1 Tax=Olea europaea var. sylvestris TaxID=158386 RepID=UPI000C1D42EB|nr:fatty-acid-binding protein 1-like isoform X1 [Olea europaea var. sylvestris]